MDRENYFILLELPFDPPENDEKKIEDAIAKKKQQWSKDSTNPVKKTKALENISRINEITGVMLDSAKRLAEAADAKKIKLSKSRELDRRLGLYAAKGDELSDRDLKTLIKDFGQFGYSEQEIRELFNKKAGGSDKGIDLTNVLSKSQANNVKNQMQALGMKDSTLYEVLNMAPNSTCDQLRATADAMKKKELAKGGKTARGNAIQALCGLCSIIFKDEESREKYDNYVNITKYGVVNDAVDEIALSNSRKIEPKMKESLIDIAVKEYHVSVSDASVYINNYCSYMGYSLPDNKIVCGLCGAENPAGSTNCTGCGKALIIICPSCSSQNNNSAKTCAKCGFDLTKMDEAVSLLKDAKQRYAEKNLDEAEKLVKKAKALWPNHPDICALEKTISDDRSKAAKAIADIMKDISEKKFYSARTRIEQAKNSGYKVDDSISSKVSATIRDVESRLSAMRGSSKDDAFNIAVSLSDVISDSQELERSLKSFPPDGCPNFSVRVNGDSFTLSWNASPSSGNLTYHLIRKENVCPNNPNDGTEIYKGKELSFTDLKPEKNKVLYYCVFVERIGVFSNAARLAEPVAIVEGVSKLRAAGGDGMVTLSWNKANTVKEIRLWKYKGAERSADEKAYEAVNCSRLDGISLSGLSNGDMYWFAVSAGHNLNGKTFYSEKAYISAVPQRPAKPLENFDVHFRDDIFTATWKESEWDVILFYSNTRPDYGTGIIYDLDDLLSKYTKIDMNLNSTTQADFRISFVGECYIIPGVINASNVILNSAVTVTSVPPVKDVSFDLNTGATEMYVNFTWPKKTLRSLLVYRMDEYPSGPDDPLAVKIECSKKQYDSNEGILISNPAQGTFYSITYIYVDTDEKRVYSEGVKALLSNEPQKDVFYTFKYKKGGRFSKTCRLSLTIETTGNCVFPAFVVVSKFKGTPLKRTDGDIACSVAENTQINGHHTFEFDVAPLQSGTRLKLFFVNDKYYKAFRIACKAGNNI